MLFDLHNYDFIIAFIYLIAGYPILYVIFKKNYVECARAYTYKAVFAYAFCLIYIFYYKQGDTFYYWINSEPYVNLLLDDPLRLIQVIVEEPSLNNYYYFTNKTGYPDQSFFYKKDYAVITMFKLIFFIRLFAFENYICATLILGLLSFIVLFKFYLFFKNKYQTPYLKYAILYVPSVGFWSSGILKDSFTFSATILVVYALNKLFLREKPIKYGALLAFGIYIIISVKPYILLSLLPATMIWLFWRNLNIVRHPFLRIFLIPILIIFGIGFGTLIWQSISPFLGAYSNLDSITQKAYVSYNDLKRKEYRGNSFDLGDYDASVQGMLSKFAPATFTGLFRPMMFEANTVTVWFSALENLLFLILTLWIIVRIKVKLLTVISSDPFLIFCLAFSIIFAFSIAISTSNFGAMVRFKIPLIPFYLMMLLVINQKYTEVFQSKKSSFYLPLQTGFIKKDIKEIPKA